MDTPAELDLQPLTLPGGARLVFELPTDMEEIVYGLCSGCSRPAAYGRSGTLGWVLYHLPTPVLPISHGKSVLDLLPQPRLLLEAPTFSSAFPPA